MAKLDRSLMEESIGAVRSGFSWVVVFSFGVNMLMLAAPLYMLQVYDRVLASRSEDTLLLLTLIAGIAVLTMAALEAVRTSLLIRISTWLDKRLAGHVLTNSVSASLLRTGQPSAQGLRDLATCRTFLTGPGVFPILDAPWAPIFLAFIYLLHPVLGWIAIGGAIVLFGMAILNELATRRLLSKAGGASIKALQEAEAAVRNADAIEAMGMMGNLVHRWNRVNEESLSLQAQASSRSGAITSISKFIRLMLQIIILGVGAWLVIGVEITPGAMIAAAILMSRALAPVEQAISSWKMAVAARSAYFRVKNQLESAPIRGESMPLPTPRGDLAVEGVVYIHPGQSDPLLRNINFRLDAGEVLGLIGPSGVGKTTLARLLLGNLTPRIGHVRLDGMDVAAWDASDRGRHCGYLPQDVELFNGTIRENIARMSEGDPDMVIEAARLARVHELIVHFPNGYDTEIGDSGGALSGGERQRIALARALYGQPRFVVLDEPNSNLDASGEEALMDAISELKSKQVTLVIIGQRPSVLQHVDKVLVLKNGIMQMFGPREEILAKVMGDSSNTSKPWGVVSGKES